MLNPRLRLAGSPLVPGAVLSVGRPGPDYQPVRGAATGTLHVIAGPDAGFGVALRPGRYFIGRAVESHVYLSNADVSRMHALVEVSADGVALISDAGSRNGTWVNGAEATRATPLDGDSLLWIGKDTLRWTAGAGPLPVTQAADGRLEFDRVFAAPPAIPVREVAGPPTAPARRNFGAMATSGLLGLVAGPAVFAGTHDPPTLLASLAGPAALLVTGTARGYGRRKQRRASDSAWAATREHVAALVAQEERVRHQLAPGPAAVTALATGGWPGPWPREARSPDGLVLRVGVADQPSSVRLIGSPGDDRAVPALRGVPVTVDLRETGVLGVTGAGEQARALLRWLIIQLATLRSPADLRLVLLTAGDPGGDEEGDGPADADLRWARWLPHLDGGGTAETPCLIGNTDASRAARLRELSQLITVRMADRGRPGAAPGGAGAGEVVVVIDGARALRNLPGIEDILLLGPKAGVYVVCADDQGISECRGGCELTGDGLRLTRAPGTEPVTGVPDGIDQGRAEQVARALAPMRDRLPAVAGSAIPYPAPLLSLLGTGVPSAAGILALWGGKPGGPTTRVVLGADASGPATVDLAAQGPHTLLGGAAGTGKSTLLQTLVTALLLANRPDELNLVLVDVKGDGTFLPFENCPHVTAFIRSAGETAAGTFGKADAARVLAAVRAEMNRREAILSQLGGEIDNHWRAHEIQPALPRLPRVVMIFDEFARVLEASPDFLEELVQVAARGRSLGVHLVLATEALPGKLSPELKSHIDLRISFRQDETAESVEVLGAPDAVTIPRALRGRGLIACTRDEGAAPRPFQAGYLGDPPPAVNDGRLAVRPLAWAGLGVAGPASATGSGTGATDRALVIKAIEEAARHIRFTRQTWRFPVGRR